MRKPQNVDRRTFLGALGATAISASCYRASSQENPLNFVLIMADDLGFSDIGCYGGEIETPNLDSLALRGIRLSNFYNEGVCVPSRAALLTGIYSHRSAEHVADPPPSLLNQVRSELRKGIPTIADLLREKGYFTAMSGKWHLGDERDNWPIRHGFDRYFGLLSGASNYFQLSPGRRMALDDSEYFPPEDFYMTDAISEYAVSFLKERPADRPFFLYVSYTAPHWPLHALPEDIERYRGRYLEGWDAVRAERFRRLKEFGIIPADSRLTPRHELAPEWTSVKNRDEWDLRMAVYAAQVDRMDQGIGRIMQTIQSLGDEPDTLIVFLSDNGADCAHLLHREEGAAAEGIPPGPAESFTSYGLPWGNASNTPFRFFKSWTHEGGISSPFIAAGPGIRESGAVRHEVGHLIDLAPTILEMAGNGSPDALPQINSFDGQSLAPQILRNSSQGERTIFWNRYGNRAVRRGNWKLLRRNPADVEHFRRWGYSPKAHDAHWELYELGQDRTEMTNLAESKPEVVEDLKELYFEWATSLGLV